MSQRDDGLSVEIVADRLVISIGVNALAVAAVAGPYFDRLFQGKEPNVTADVFAKEILSELTRESEDGSTLVHLMLDKAAENAVEQGAEGIAYP